MIVDTCMKSEFANPKFEFEISRRKPCLITITPSGRKISRVIKRTEFFGLLLLSQGLEIENIVKIMTSFGKLRASSVRWFIPKLKSTHIYILRNISEKQKKLSFEQIQKYLQMYNGEPWVDNNVIYRDDAPRQVRWAITDQCYARCIYCYLGLNSSESSKRKFHVDNLLSKSTVMKTLQELHEIGCGDLVFTGGDPFTRPDMVEILEQSTKLGLPQVGVITKIPLSKEILGRLRGLYFIGWSLDSLDDGITEELTRVPKFATRIVDSIRNALNLNMPVRVQSVVTKLNIATIPNWAETLLKMGVEIVRISPFRATGIAVERDDLCISEEDWQKVRRAIMEVEKKFQLAPHQRVQMTSATTLDPHFSENEGIAAHMFYENNDENSRHIGCNCSHHRLWIFPDGTVGACDNIPIKIGNITKESILEIWQPHRWQKFLSPKRECYLNSQCYDCQKFDSCELRYVCFGDSYTYHGQIHSPPVKDCYYYLPADGNE